MVKKKTSRTPKKKGDKEKTKREKPLAKVFFIAYTRDDVGNTAKRPVTFSFNGGPGSASVWLHMGGLGPRRAVLTERGEALPPPYRLEDNAYSWLDESDLVFIDPVSTGYSRPEPGEDPKNFTVTKKTSRAWANSSGFTRRNINAGPRRNLSRAKATARRAPRA